MKPYLIASGFLVTIAVLVFTLISVTGCATTGGSSTLTNAEAFAWTVADQYEKANTGGVLTQSIASAILKATKSDATTTQEVLIATQLADKVAAAGIAAHNAGATPAGVQAAQTVVLSDPGVIEKVAASSGS